MNILFSIVGFLIAVSVLILIHECGHFFVARSFKVKVMRFSIGFGKPFLTWRGKQSQIEYAIAPFLIGGYVKFLDSNEAEVAAEELPRAFDKKPTWQRFLIIAAGPITNLIFALLAFWLMFVVGVQSPKPIIGRVLPHSIASVAGMHAGEEIIRVGKKATASWQDVMFALLSKIGDQGRLLFQTQLSPMTPPNSYQLDLNRWQVDQLHPDPIGDFGMIPFHPIAPPIIGNLDKKGPAAKAGLLKGDVILAIDGKHVNNWDEFIEVIAKHPEQKLVVKFRRGGKVWSIPVIAGWKFAEGWKKRGYFGVASITVHWPKESLRENKYSLLRSVGPSFAQAWSFIDINAVILGKLIAGKISLRVLGGPISIFSASGAALSHGIEVYIGFLAVLSLTLAFINFLPLPALDGGYLVILLVEAIIRRPVPPRVQWLIFRLGMILFLLLIVQATINDLARLF